MEQRTSTTLFDCDSTLSIAPSRFLCKTGAAGLSCEVGGIYASSSGRVSGKVVTEIDPLEQSFQMFDTA